MITGKTSTGFAFALPENKLQDMRILRALAATMKAPDEADPFAQLTALDDLGTLILGAESPARSRSCPASPPRTAASRPKPWTKNWARSWQPLTREKTDSPLPCDCPV